MPELVHEYPEGKEHGLEDARDDGRRLARKIVAGDKLYKPDSAISANSITQAMMTNNSIGVAQFKYETATVTISGTATSGTATVTSGDVIIGLYVSAISGAPADPGTIQASISGTTLTITFQNAPGNSTSITTQIVLLKT